MANIRSRLHRYAQSSFKLKIMKTHKQKQSGFSLIELMIAMTLTLVVLGVTVGLFARAFNTRTRESRRTDALTAAQAAISVMSREIGNSGYGLYDASNSVHKNGIVTADSNGTKIRIRSNPINQNPTTTDPGEDVTYYFDAAAKSIVRYDANVSTAPSYVINRVSRVDFIYCDYQLANPIPTCGSTPSNNTGTVRILVRVEAEPVNGQPTVPVLLTSEVTLRNSDYMIKQY